MLKSLKIKNLALVDDAFVSFQKGLNVITGETGAGKSLLMGALRLLLGERADRSMIRSGADSCSISGAFSLGNAGRVNRILEEIGLEPCDGGFLSIRRVIRENSNKAWVNDEPVTLQILRRLGKILVDMHGPHDHQSLLDPAVQLAILDAFGKVDGLHKSYFFAYQKVCQIEKQLDALSSGNEEEREREIEFLAYRIEEVEAANLSTEEDTEVEEEHGLMAHAQEVAQLASGSVMALSEGEGCAFDGLVSAQQYLTQLARLMPEAKVWQEAVERAVAEIQETVREIEHSVSEIDASPERMQWLDDRLTTYRTLKRKYGSTVEEVLAECEAWKKKLEMLRGRDQQLAILEAERDAAKIIMEKAGLILREGRESVAHELSEQITKELADIGFEHGFFEVQIFPESPSASGVDRVEFGFAPNAGEPMRPLRQIASSGEISRVMLAVKTVLSKHDQIPLLVFDEIDANIGGEIGGAVGRKLQHVAQYHQLICITHLPQVAACGTTHLAVGKQVHDGRTFTEIRLLTPSERPIEIARMLGTQSEATLQHARTLLENSPS